MKLSLRWSIVTLLTLTSAGWSQTLRHIAVDSAIAEELSKSFEAQGYDVVEGSVQQGSLELVVTESELEHLESLGFSLRLLQVGRPFRDVQQELGATPERPGYPDLDAVLAEMSLAAANFPGICEYVNLTQKYGVAQTFEGRDLFAVKISDNPGVEENEPAFLIVGAHHCRETVTPLICLEAISQLTTQYGIDSQITAAVDGHEIWIAPVWNPDGYAYVFDVDNLWRKNRRPFGGGNFGVDLNRNYPYGWSAPCGGSTAPSSTTYRGPSAASEAETQTMLAWSADQRFAKVMDYHSFGREILWEYACSIHPLASFLQADGIRISNASGYAGANRPPSAEGEHYEWQLAAYSNWAYLIETHTSFQPSVASAQNEAVQLFGGIRGMLLRPSSISGTVTGTCSGLPLEAEITFGSFTFNNGEQASSGGPFGRYDIFLPVGPETLTFTAPDYEPQTIAFTATENTGQVFDIELVPLTALTLEASTTGTGLGGLVLNVQSNCNLAGQSFAIVGTTKDDRDPSGYEEPLFRTFGTLDADGRARIEAPAAQLVGTARSWTFRAFVSQPDGTRSQAVLQVPYGSF